MIRWELVLKQVSIFIYFKIVFGQFLKGLHIGIKVHRA